jgi:DNA-binding transcriptional LysR family regulator
MELLQLRYFQTVARLQHMTKAAEELHIAQPSLSKTIARLEEDLGVPLFDRQGRQIKLNAYGEKFLHRVERIFLELKEGQREILDLAGLQEESVTLAVTIPRVLPDLLGSFLQQHPHVRIQQFLESTSSMKRQLEAGSLDFCISSLPIVGEDIEWKPLMTEEIFLLIPPAHPFAGRETIELHEVQHEFFVSMNAGYGFRNLTDAFCEQAGFRPQIAFEGDEPGVISELVRQGLGIAFVPELSWKAISEAWPNRLKISEPACRRTIGLAWSKRHYLSRAAQRFHEFTVAYFAKLANDELDHGNV